MTKAEWQAATDPERLVRWLDKAQQTGTLIPERKFRIYSVAACREAWASLTIFDRQAVAFAEVEVELRPDDAERERQASLVRDTSPSPEGYSPSGAVSFLLCHSRSPYRLDSLSPSQIAVAVCLNLLSSNAVSAATLSRLVHEIVGNPFRPVAFSPSWRTDTAVALANLMYDSRDFGAMPILADALQDAGCDNEDILYHCRGPGPHVRGCWVVDLVLGKE